jgi:hypothetical protein
MPPHSPSFPRAVATPQTAWNTPTASPAAQDAPSPSEARHPRRRRSRRRAPREGKLPRHTENPRDGENARRTPRRAQSAPPRSADPPAQPTQLRRKEPRPTPPPSPPDTTKATGTRPHTPQGESRAQPRTRAPPPEGTLPGCSTSSRRQRMRWAHTPCPPSKPMPTRGKAMTLGSPDAQNVPTLPPCPCHHPRMPKTDAPPSEKGTTPRPTASCPQSPPRSIAPARDALQSAAAPPQVPCHPRAVPRPMKVGVRLLIFF